MKKANIAPKKHRRGFTLIECIVVLAVISLVLIVTVPRLGIIYDRQLVEQQVRLVESDLLWLRSEAARTGGPTIMQCGVGEGYTLTILENEEAKTETRALVSKRLTMSTNARYGQVIFQPRGTAFEKCTIRIQSGEVVRTVVVNNLGRIRVGRGHER